MNVKPGNLNTIIQDALEIIKITAERKKHTIIVNKKSRFLKNFMCDSARIKQIIINVLSNSIKYTPDGGKITINASKKHIKDSLYDIRIVISDNGRGIKRDDLGKLFHAFERINGDSMGRSIEGTGLGLIITRKLLSLMDGTIKITSEGENKGTTVTLHLKLNEKNEDFIKYYKGNGRKFIENKRVLVVDDNTVNRNIISEILSSWGLMCLPCSSAFDALTFIKSDIQIDIALIDIKMPNMDGNTLCSKIKDIRPDIPLVAVSSTETSEISDQFDEFYIKPVEENSFINIIIDLLENTNVDHDINCDKICNINYDTIRNINRNTIRNNSINNKKSHETIFSEPSESLSDDDSIEIVSNTGDTQGTPQITSQSTSQSTSKSALTQKTARPIISSNMPESTNISNDEPIIIRPRQVKTVKKEEICKLGPNGNLTLTKKMKKTKILIVDDNEANGRVLNCFFKELFGLDQITIAHDGKEAWDIIQNDPIKYKLIIMDIIMPIMNGIAASRKIKKHCIRKNIKSPYIITTSASPDKLEIDKYINKGYINDHLTKPIDQGKFIKKIKSFFCLNS